MSKEREGRTSPAASTTDSPFRIGCPFRSYALVEPIDEIFVLTK